jgi:hypothetical protein
VERATAMYDSLPCEKATAVWWRFICKFKLPLCQKGRRLKRTTAVYMTAYLVKKPQLFYEVLYANLSCLRHQGRRVQ